MPEFPAYKTAQVKSLIPYARNSRTHSEKQVAKIAASIREFGFLNPIIVDGEDGIIAGHGRLLAAELLEMDEVPTVEAAHLSETQKRAYIIADNRLALDAGWDDQMLRVEFAALDDAGFDLELTGFTLDEIKAFEPEPERPPVDETDIPEPPAKPVTAAGDIWVMDGHRVMCGDSTSAEAVASLCAGQVAQLIHADPPYGMGKQADGVMNDNLYREKLDSFQLDWWRAFRAHADDNASAYIWGNAMDLWRLWYSAGLADTENLTLRNEIVWDKKSIAGMKSSLLTQYPIASERCLYFQFGDQFLGNVNADQYWEGWDSIRLYLEGEAKAAGLNSAKCREITGVQMYAHWFSKSQWSIINEKYYGMLAEATGRFQKPYAELRREYDEIKGGYRNHVNGILGGMRSYFDNSHDIMRDVWEFPRVTGEDREGHATPKPVAMMERVMRSSIPEGGLCVEPFAGSGSTLMGAEVTGRKCYTMELDPRYVDVVVKRWQKYTGKQAVHAETGELFDER